MVAHRPVTLQINVAPTDLPHAVATLPHQLRQWARQVDEILFTLDLHRTARGGRFAEGWEERRQPMQQLLTSLCEKHSNARIDEVEYTSDRVRAVAQRFFACDWIPAKDTKGAPFFPYFHGLDRARHDLILHLDSDLLFGGCSQTWIAEARELLETHEEILACGPLPGPPAADGMLHSQNGEPIGLGSPAFQFRTISTRLFMVDRSRLLERLAPLRLRGPIRTISMLKARLHGNPPYAAAEIVLSAAMAEKSMSRVDFLGESPGMWSLHPPYRSPAFCAALPELIRRIEKDEAPASQLGRHEIVDDLFDFSAARRRARLRRIWA
ncbi:MAG TPA: hypothetical protein VKU89_04725 [Solirubrobacteraceae bacterium]|nr:hypothetical protein [Solirubrobacteraceae bacterium]